MAYSTADGVGIFFLPRFFRKGRSQVAIGHSRTVGDAAKNVPNGLTKGRARWRQGQLQRVRPGTGKIAVQPIRSRHKDRQIRFFFPLRAEGGLFIFLSGYPEARQACTIAGQENRADRRRIRACIFHMCLLRMHPIRQSVRSCAFS